MYYMYENHFYGAQNICFPAAGLLSRSRLRGTQGARLYTMVQMCVPDGVRGRCSGRLKSRNLASNQYDSHNTTAVVLQAFPCVTDMNRAFACV